MANEDRQVLIEKVRMRLARQLASRGHPPEAVDEAANVLDPNALMLGFARRFTGYKRPNLLLRDPARLARLLNDPVRPVQLVLAGKAHPADVEGKRMIRDWIEIAQRPEFRRRIVFLEDYDIALAQELVQGVDVWINTPRRPLGSVRDERHEGPGQWRPQSVRARRLVGRGVCGRPRLGDRRWSRMLGRRARRRGCRGALFDPRA